ncbi:WD40-repeat-containing domain protein, partial [Suillus plorans]
MNKFYLQRSFRGHKAPINCMCFSEEGYLASGGDDGHIMLWSMAESSEILRIRPKQGPITALKWVVGSLTSAENFLLSGGADGTMQLRKLSGDKVNVLLSTQTVFPGAVMSIEVEDAQGIIAATGPGRVVLFRLSVGKLEPLQCLLADPPFSQDPRPALVVSTHFFQKGKSILVSYLDSREIVAWSISPWKELWRQKFGNRIGSSAYSDSLGSLLVWNLVDGINVYRLTDNPTCHLLLVQTLRIKIRRNRICDVQFDSTGEFAISGSDNGELHLWNIDSGQLDQALCHG